MSVAEIESRELELEHPPSGLWRDAFGAACAATPARSSGFVIVALFVFVAIFAPLIAPYDPTEQNLDARSRTAAARARRASTCSASTSSAATSSRASSTAPATRS